MNVTHEDIRAGRLNIYRLTEHEAQDIVTEYDAVVRERDSLQQYVGIIESDRNRLVRECDDLRTRLAASQTSHAASIKHNAGLVKELEAAESERDRLRQENAKLKTNNLLTNPSETPNSSPLDLTKPVKTRSGRKVRVLCTDRKGSYPIVGLIMEERSEEAVSWKEDGTFYQGSQYTDYDLVQDVPQPAEGECWVYGWYKDGEWTTCSVSTREKNWQPSGCCRIRVRLIEGKFDV